MFGRVVLMVVALGLGAVAKAEVVVELIPDRPGPYVGGESLTLDVWLHSQIASDVRLSLIQFDFSDSDPALALDPMFTFDYSSIPDAFGYLERHPDLPVPWTANWLECVCPEIFLPLAAGGSLHIGSIGVQLPTAGGVYRLDALNADALDPSQGAMLNLRGLVWRAYTGEITGEGFDFVVGPPIPSGEVVVELVPDNPGPYNGGESLTVDVWLHSEVAFDAFLEDVQLAFSDSDPALFLDTTFTFDLSAIPNPEEGVYGVFPAMPVPGVGIIVFSYVPPESMLPLPAGGSLHIGSIGVQLPIEWGVYRLDALNVDEPDVSHGALIDVRLFPDYVRWRAFTGEIKGGGLEFVGQCLLPADPPLADEIDDGAGGTAISYKNRYLSFKDNNAGRLSKVRVTLADIPAQFVIQDPQNPQLGEFLDPSFVDLIGTKMWVGEPELLCTASGGTGHGEPCPVGTTGQTIRVAPLVCEDDPDNQYRDWSAYASCRYRECRRGSNDGSPCTEDTECPDGNCVSVTHPDQGKDCTGDPAVCTGGSTCQQDVIHAYHEFVFPGGEYAVQLLGSMCDAANEGKYSPALELVGPVWGDLVGARIPPAGGWTSPNVDIDVIDLLAIQDAAASRLAAPIKSRTDLEGVGSPIVDGIIGVTEILRVQDAARRLPYPYPAPAPPCSEPQLTISFVPVSTGLDGLLTR